MTYDIQSSSAQSKYNTWSDPNAPTSPSRQQATDNLQGFVGELNKLIGEAERDRAAAPAFLRDLRDLSRRYDVPWRTDIINETFSDGNFTANPTWRVTSGRWWVEKNFGLRAAFDSSSSQSNSSTQQSNDDIGKQLLGAILNQALGGNQKSTRRGSTSPSKSVSQAAIHLDQTISNAFSTTIEFTSWRNEGSFEIATYQGADRKNGYRLFYHPNQTNSLKLVRSSRTGTNVIQNYTQMLKLEDKRTHVLAWDRDRVGNMTISIDGKKLMTVQDQGFYAPFSGLSLINNGGDYIISKVAIKGTK